MGNGVVCPYSYSCGSCGRQGRTFEGGFTAANGQYVSDADAVARAAADFMTADGLRAFSLLSGK